MNITPAKYLYHKAVLSFNTNVARDLQTEMLLVYVGFVKGLISQQLHAVEIELQWSKADCYEENLTDQRHVQGYNMVWYSSLLSFLYITMAT